MREWLLVPLLSFRNPILNPSCSCQHHCSLQRNSKRLPISITRRSQWRCSLSPARGMEWLWIHSIPIEPSPCPKCGQGRSLRCGYSGTTLTVSKTTTAPLYHYITVLLYYFTALPHYYTTVSYVVPTVVVISGDSVSNTASLLCC